MRISAYFFGVPGGALDKAARHIFESHDGKGIGAGMMMAGGAAGERDVEYDVPEHRANVCKATLEKAGFRLEPTRSEGVGEI